MQTLGMRHIALNVSDPQVSKDFYCRHFGMEVEWEPDAENVYLTSGGLDNLALHKAPLPEKLPARGEHALDHIGFFVKTESEVDEAFQAILQAGVEIVKPLKKHRDGATSFYLKDPDGIVIQVLYHPPVSKRWNEG